MANDPALGGFTVEIGTDKGVKGYGRGGPGGGFVVEKHLTKLLLNEDPFNVERIWDILWRSTMSYGRAGVVINAISGVDLALWDLSATHSRCPCISCWAGNEVAHSHLLHRQRHRSAHEAGFKRLKLAIPYGPADGKKECEEVER